MGSQEKGMIFTEPGNPMYVGLRYYLFQRERVKDKPESQNIQSLINGTKIARWLGEDSVNRAVNEMLDQFPEFDKLEGGFAYCVFDDLVVFLLHAKVNPKQSEALNNMWRDLARQVASQHSEFWQKEGQPYSEQPSIEEIYSRNKSKASFYNQLKRYRQLDPIIDLDNATSPTREIDFNEGEDDSRPKALLGFRLPEVERLEGVDSLNTGILEISEEEPAEPVATEVDRPMIESEGSVLEFLKTIGRRLHDGIDEEYLAQQSHRLQHLIAMRVPREELEEALGQVISVEAGPVDEKILSPARRLLRDYTRLDQIELEPAIRAIKKQVAARLTEELIDIVRIEAEEGWDHRTIATRKEMVSYLKASVSPLLEALVRKYPPRKAYLKFRGVSRLVEQSKAEWA